MFQGVFDVLLAQKIVSNLLFEKCSSTFLVLFGISFHTLAPLYEKLFLVISSLGLGICTSFALLVSYFET